MKFLVTGANGYVGRHVVDALVALGHDVTAATRGEPGTQAGARPLRLDVLDAPDDVYELTGRPDVCIHLAWENGFAHNSPSHIQNADRHIRFMRNMLSGGLKHLVGIGTAHEIGPHVGPVTETTPTNPIHAYGVAKNYLQRVQKLLCAEHGATDQWLRCYYITGDDARNNSIFRRMLDAVAEGKTTFPLNSGELLFDFIDVHELGRQIALVSSQKEVTGIINCCSGVPTSLKTMVLRFIAENKLPIEPQWGAFPIRPYDSLAIWGDPEKLRLALAAAEPT